MTGTVQDSPGFLRFLTALNTMLANASGSLWTAAYVGETGDAAADIRSDMAVGLQIKAAYWHLCRQIDDTGVRETIDFLFNRIRDTSASAGLGHHP